MKSTCICFLLAFHALSFSQQTVYDKTFNPDFFIHASYGFSWRTSEIPSGIPRDVEQYAKDLSNGNALEFGLGYKINNMSYVRILMNRYFASSEIATINGDSKINFYGAAFGIMSKDRFNNELQLEMAIGYNDFYQSLNIPQVYNSIEKGGNLAVSAQFGYYFKLGKGFFIGPNMSYFFSNLSEVRFSENNEPFRTIDLGDEEVVGLGRFNLFLTLKYNLY